MNLGLVVACCTLLVTAMATAQTEPASVSGPFSPQQALQHFKLADQNLVIELVACEPEVSDPVAICFDERGRLWVVEMHDYPHGPAAGEAPLSRIRRLEDRDGDGYFETAHTFADQLLFPTGLQPWRGGWIVTLSGRVVYLRDTDDDGRADYEELWFSGFTEENSQLRANHPTLGLDTHIYVANGLRGGDVKAVRSGDGMPVSIRNRDFRFDPLGSDFRAISGHGQFGLTFDDFGRRFVCSNRNPLQHVVIEDRYLQAHPTVAIPAVVHDVAAAGEQSQLFPISRTWTTSTLHANQFTAACGVLIFRGTALGPNYHGNGFTCDPTGNLIHRELLQPVGGTFHSKPAHNGMEFLATTDEWFRAVNLEDGPDGALYVVDMYRAVIEHPQFMPDELKQRSDLRNGEEKGRIYRIRQKGERPKVAWPEQLDRQSLVEWLQQENAWQRETAARLLLEQEATDTADALQAVVRQSSSPPARAQALWLLARWQKLPTQLLVTALADESPGVREQALVLAETRLDESPELRALILGRTSDKDSRVRFQAVLSLGAAQSPEEATALADVLWQAPGDVWTRHAVSLVSESYSAALALAALQRLPDRPARAAQELLRDLFASAGNRAAGAPELPLLSSLLETAANADQRSAAMAGLAGLLNAWNRRGIDWRAALKDAPEMQQSLEQLAAHAEEQLLASRDVPERQLALEIVALADRRTLLQQLALQSAEDVGIRVQALRLAASGADDVFWSQLLQMFPSESPQFRTAIVSTALDRTATTAALLTEIEQGRIKPGELGRTDLNRLERVAQPELKQRAAKVLEALAPQDRQEALTRYQPSLAMDSDPLRGRAVFARHCAVCHRVGDVGVDVAPDIADSRTKTPEQLLLDIIQPNRAIDGNYISYLVETEDGRTLTGIIASETATSVTLRQPENKSETLSRDDIAVIRSTGTSLMPDGLEQNISLQEMADLISFIKNWRYLDGRIPLGQ